MRQRQVGHWGVGATAGKGRPRLSTRGSFFLSFSSSAASTPTAAAATATGDSFELIGAELPPGDDSSSSSSRKLPWAYSFVALTKDCAM
jgi:hypothetical protein